MLLPRGAPSIRMVCRCDSVSWVGMNRVCVCSQHEVGNVMYARTRIARGRGLGHSLMRGARVRVWLSFRSCHIASEAVIEIFSIRRFVCGRETPLNAAYSIPAFGDS
jgi:hypothetical protein